VVKRFADMEVFVEVQENVRGEDVFVLQSTSFPANDNLMELLILVDALKRASARTHHGGNALLRLRAQDRKPGPRTPISAKLVANLIERAGVDRVMTSTCMPARSRASSTFRPTTCSPPRHGARHPGAVRSFQSGRGIARRRRRGARARPGQAHQRADRHLRQAARAGGRVGGDEL
jgi:hypothetical protein